MSDPRKPILCLDFDGVLHSYTSGWKGANNIPDPPVPGAQQFVNRAVEVFDVHIFSSRSNQPGGIFAMRSWMRQHFAHSVVDQLQFPQEKPPALVTLDDRAICFTGEWPDLSDLLTFRPWNK